MNDASDALSAASRSITDAETPDAEEAVARFIHSRINFERLPTERYELSDFKLERTRSLMRRLGDPQEQIPAIHIAGTKGKGSTAAMIAAVLQATGRRIGLFTSPHLEHFSERMTVDGVRPTAEELLSLLDDLRPVVEAMDEEVGASRPTFFEVLTAMAWLHFRNREVDLVVLETGLGGRLDATNVCAPLVCIITSISRDHERLLGSTLAEISGEKAGIIKPGIPIISGVTSAEPRDVIRRRAVEQAAPLTELATDVHWQLVDESTTAASSPHVPQHATIAVQTPWRKHGSLRSPLPGKHQADNLALAVAALDCLDASGYGVPHSAVVDGLQRVEWPLRVEVLGREPLVVVDAAHNVASIAALVETLAPLQVSERVVVYSSARDKDTAGMLAQLADAFDRVIFTQFVRNPRAVSRATLEGLATEQLRIPWAWAENPTDAWQLAARSTNPDGLICATGSFFLAAEFRAVVRGAGDDVSIE